MKEEHGFTHGFASSHRINLAGEADLDGEVFDWMKKAYERAG